MMKSGCFWNLIIFALIILIYFQAGKSLSTFVCATGPSPAAESSSSEKPSTEDDNDEVESSTKTAVEAILFSPADGNQLITGTLEGVVTIWDVSTRVIGKTWIV
jgi:hypothetical protein